MSEPRPHITTHLPNLNGILPVLSDSTLFVWYEAHKIIVTRVAVYAGR